METKEEKPAETDATVEAAVNKFEQQYREAQTKAQLRVLDPEDEFHLAGVLPFEDGEFAEYVPKAFRKSPESDQAVFELDGYSRADVKAYRAAIAAGLDSTEEAVKILKSSGVKGWRNLKSRKGKLIEVGDKSFLDRAHEAMITELHAVCWAYATGVIPVEMEGLG